MAIRNRCTISITSPPYKKKERKITSLRKFYSQFAAGNLALLLVFYEYQFTLVTLVWLLWKHSWMCSLNYDSRKDMRFYVWVRVCDMLHEATNSSLITPSTFLWCPASPDGSRFPTKVKMKRRIKLISTSLVIRRIIGYDAALSKMVATAHLWLSSTENVAGPTWGMLWL